MEKNGLVNRATKDKVTSCARKSLEGERRSPNSAGPRGFAQRFPTSGKRPFWKRDRPHLTLGDPLPSSWPSQTQAAGASRKPGGRLRKRYDCFMQPIQRRSLLQTDPVTFCVERVVSCRLREEIG